ncbi:toxin TcdB middle/C-terminal domain-containing protein [Phytomonospora sp. NPDC050363]|uniref:toxin TcdB middle/C-terminal domain-containing protein n=1 Tax=Phytomonospora sp. NPDC050363 TaxID=3155642 RepID=UPI0034043581
MSARTATWLHDGLDPDRTGYHPAAAPLAGPLLPEDLTADERHAVAGLLDGRLLRTEVYGDDGSERAAFPYLITEHRYGVRRGRAGALLVHPLETVTTHVERALADPDPRVVHDLVLSVGACGTVLESVRIGYPRLIPKQPGQEVAHVLLTRRRTTDSERPPGAIAETLRFEVTGLRAVPGRRFTVAELREAVAASTVVPYEGVARPDRLRHRLTGHDRVLYWDDDFTGPLPLGRSGSAALAHSAYRLALTPGLLAEVFAERIDDTALDAAGYLRDDEGCWIPADAPRAGGVEERGVAGDPGTRLERDPLGRVTRVEHADGTVSEVDYHAWRREHWDACDTVLSSRWYADRGSPDPLTDEPEAPELRAAWLAAHHADTPATTHLGPLGREMIEVVDADGLDQFTTHTRLDVGGNVLEVLDARGTVALTRVVDLLGRELRAVSPDFGERLTLPDAAGRPVRSWSGGGEMVVRTFDHTGSACETWVHDGAGRMLSELVVRAEAGCLLVFDQAGMARVTRRSVARRLPRDHRSPPDWSPLAGLDAAAAERVAETLLEADGYELETIQDGDTRHVRCPDGTRVTRRLDESGRLSALFETPPEHDRPVPVIAHVRRDPAGRALLISYGDGTAVRRAYDPIGALVADGPARYSYDALGRVLRAEGPSGILCRSYDAVGNPLSTVYTGPDGAPPRIVRFHHAEDPETGEPLSNRLVAHSTPADAEGVFSALVEYDERGNMTEVPHLPGALLSWDHAGRLCRIDFGDGRRAFYAHDSGGTRIRAVVEHPDGTVDERVHIGDWTLSRTTREGVVVAEERALDLVDGAEHLGRVDLAVGAVSPEGRVADPETGFEFRGCRLLAPWLGRNLSPGYAHTGPVAPAWPPDR